MAASDRKRWKAPEGPPLTGGRLVADRLLMVLVAGVLAAALATPLLKRGPGPVADSPHRSLHIVWIAAPNDRLDLPFLPYAGASRSALEALTAEPYDPDEPESPKPAGSHPAFRVTSISAATEAQVRGALRDALAGHAPGDSLLVYLRGHLIPGVNTPSLVCGDARLIATPPGDPADRNAKPGPKWKGVVPIADLVGLIDAAPARCRLLVLEPGALPLEPGLGVYLDDYLAGLAAPGRVDAAPTVTDDSVTDDSATDDSAADASEQKSRQPPANDGPTTIVLSRPPHAGEFLRPNQSATRFFAAVRETLTAPAAADKNKDQSLSLGEFRTALARAAAPDRPIAIRSGRLVSPDNPAADGDPLLAVAADKTGATSGAAEPALPEKEGVLPQKALLDSIRRSRTRLTALMTPPDEPGGWPLLSAPRRLLSTAALLARTEEQVLFERHSSAELTDIEIGLQKVGRDLDAIEMEARATEATAPMTAGTSRDLWQAWAELERSRPMLVDAVRLHDRIGHLPRMEWLSPAVQEWAAALKNDAAQFAPPEKPADGSKPGPRVRRISLQGPDVKARLVERPLAELVSAIAIRSKTGINDSWASPEDIAILQGLLQSDLLSVEQRMQLMEGLVALESWPGPNPPAAEIKAGRIEVPDFALHPLAKRRFDLHRLLVLHFLGEGAIGERELLIDDVAMQLERASRGPVLQKGPDAGYLGVVYRTMLEIPASGDEPMYVVPVPPTTTPLNE